MTMVFKPGFVVKAYTLLYTPDTLCRWHCSKAHSIPTGESCIWRY